MQLFQLEKKAKEYFKKFNNTKFSYYPNGIDDEFIFNLNSSKKYIKRNKKLIVYAGNIGEGQGLHKIIPKTAKSLEEGFDFLIVGDGGIKNLLIDEIKKLNVKNVTIKTPLSRNKLIQKYNYADYFFLHLNDYPAYKKVLPSKNI